MPNCFNLIKKGNTSPSLLQDIDNELWIHFEGAIPKENNKWYLNWYNTIGLLLAMGRTLEDLATDPKLDFSSELHAVTLYLFENYTEKAWYQRRD